MVDFLTLAQQCAPSVHPTTLAAVVRTESGFNPYAIGVVAGRLERQPKSLGEAVATAESLRSNGWNASFGLGQVNLHNLGRLGLTTTTVFDPCQNLRAAATLLAEAFARARKSEPDEQKALRTALSMYYSGNAVTGFTQGYVQKVVGNAGIEVDTGGPANAIAVVGRAKPKTAPRPEAGAAARSESRKRPDRPANPRRETNAADRQPAREDYFVQNAPAARAEKPADERAEVVLKKQPHVPKPMW